MASLSSSSSSSWSSNVHVSKEEFNLFHSIDRELYALLVINLFRDPAESMQVMALWLWLERRGVRHVVKTMLSLPHFLVNELADEAVACLNLIISSHSPSASAQNPLSRADVPLTQSLLEKDAGLVPLLRANRLTAAQEIAKIANDVCVRAMADILSQVAADAAAAATAAPQQPVPPGGNRSAAAAAVPAEERTMFVTFSKGYPVFEWEVREFFTRAYGEACIESLHMQEVQGNEQSLFARIVFKKASTIDAILNGLTKAKFTINGKHVWMRKFVPKRPKSTMAVLMQHHQHPHPHPQEVTVLHNFPDSLFE